jgi:hypothetical protein
MILLIGRRLINLSIFLPEALFTIQISATKMLSAQLK